MNKTTGKWAIGSSALLALMVWLVTGFSFGKSEVTQAPDERVSPASLTTASAEKRLVNDYYEAVGTVQSRREFEVASQTSGRVLSVEIREGDRVEEGQLLVVIESKIQEAKLDHAKRALEAAQARLERADAEEKRCELLLTKNAATQKQSEITRADYLEALAEVARVASTVREADVNMEYTKVYAPEAGEIVDRMVEPGDLASIGRPLFVIHDPQDLRLEVDMREGLIDRVEVGARVDLRIDALHLDLAGTVDEMVPSGNTLSRTFLVKASFEYKDGLRSGMFGRLRFPLGERESILIPRSAVLRVGQLEQVRVLETDRVRQFFVRTGDIHGSDIEVLSGLNGDEVLVLEGRS
jgi:RND family efflux transporter MFP subunit